MVNNLCFNLVNISNLKRIYDFQRGSGRFLYIKIKGSRIYYCLSNKKIDGYFNLLSKNFKTSKEFNLFLKRLKEKEEVL